VARRFSRESRVWADRPTSERHRRNRLDSALSNGSDYMVAGHQELASQPDRELAVEVSEDHLGPAQRARILVLSLFAGVGGLRSLFFFPAAL